MPEGAIYVGRPSRWGNPFRSVDPELAVERYRRWVERELAAQAAYGFKPWPQPQLTQRFPLLPDLKATLAGRDLACWCPLEDEYGERAPCHADVLLIIANA